MLKYLVILLDDRSTAYCYCNNPLEESRLMPISILKNTIEFAMKENLNVQFVWPDYELPEEHKELISSIDHTNIVPSSLTNEADIVVYDSIPESVTKDSTIVLRMGISDFISDYAQIIPLLSEALRINVVFTDVESFSDTDIDGYATALKHLADHIEEQYIKGHSVQVNLLTDRIGLDKMNNCNAGWESMTIAPDGNFYLCPAFYYSSGKYVGSNIDGLEVKNPQLYQLSYAPICSICDAWHCRRCVWLNKKLTLEVNTPSRQQCVMTHIEREASRQLLASLQKSIDFMPEAQISMVDYIDPFEKITK